MARFSGRRVTIGLKPETVRGTAETTGFYFYPFLSASFDDKNDKKTNDSAYGNIVKSNDQITTLHSGEGDLTGKIFAEGIGYLLRLLFGGTDTPTQQGATTAYSHAFGLVNSNQHDSATIVTLDPNMQLAFALSMIDDFKLTWVKDDFTQVEIQTMSKASSTTTGLSATFTSTDDNEFLPKHLSVFLASNLAGLSGATESGAITAISFEIKKNLTVAQTTKSKDAVDDILNGDFEITGTIEKYYEDNTFKLLDANDTPQALRLQLSDSTNLAGVGFPTSLTFDFAKVKFSNYKPGYGTSDISTETIDFTGLFSLTDSKAVTATLVNKRTTAY